MRYFHVLATDYDGTIAHDGQVDDETVAALDRVKKAGRKLILVTGRELDDLLAAFPRADLFDRIVAENGALVYDPASKSERLLGPAAPPAFVDRLRAANVDPLSVGRVIVATWEPNEGIVLEAIRALGLDLQIIFNKGAVMVLPNGVNKAAGLSAALDDLNISAHNAIAVGDAENDLAFLRVCGCSVAVVNALTAVKEASDIVTERARGAGVAELIDLWLSDERRLVEAAVGRHSVRLGTALDDGREVSVRPDQGGVLITGTSGGGKSTLATAMLERLAAAGYQLCIFDPEGDYGNFEEAITFGDADTPITREAVLDAISKLGTNVTVNLLGSSVKDRPDHFADLYPAILDFRARFGRPHWILVDEAHHMLPAEGAGRSIRIDGDAPTIFITVHPETMSPNFLQAIGTVLVIGRDSAPLIETISRTLERPCPPLPERGPDVGEALFWQCRTDRPPVLVAVEKPRRALKRHTRKYAHGTLGENRSFYFRGPDQRLNLRAHNLAMFLDVGDGIDEDTYAFHLRNGDFETWMRTSIKDDELADEVANVAANETIGLQESRHLIRAAIEQRYTAPATA